MAGVPEFDTVMATPTPSPSSEFESEKPELQFEKLAMATPTPSPRFEFESEEPEIDSDTFSDVTEIADSVSAVRLEFEFEEPELQFVTTRPSSWRAFDFFESEVPGLELAMMRRRHMKLSDLFESLVSGIQELKRYRRVTTFSNVCPYVNAECRPWKFKYHHLAQMKHILPDEIEIKTVWSSVSKSRTTVAKKMTKNNKNRRYPLNPDLRIGLEVAHLHISLKCLEATITHDKDISLIDLFTEKLAEVLRSYPEGVPKEILPEPFNRKSKRYAFCL